MSLSLHEDVIVFDESGIKSDKPARKVLESKDANVETKPQRLVGDKGLQKTGKRNRKTTNKNDLVKLDTPKNTEPEQIPAQSISKPSEDSDTCAPVLSTGKVDLLPTPLPIRTRKQASQNNDPEPVMPHADEIYTRYAAPLLALSDQGAILPFEDWATSLDDTVHIEKIAEASFSEVYRLTIEDIDSSGGANESVLKLVALKSAPDEPLPCDIPQAAKRRRNVDLDAQKRKELQERQKENEWRSSTSDVHSEVRLLQNLTHIPGFTTFRSLIILQGRPSASFGRAWKDWNKSRPKAKKSQFPDPNKKASFSDTQIWAVIEMQDAGTDCGAVIEKGGISSIWEVWDIFWNVCLSVAKAEQVCRFEHRDMHMDNICIRSSEPGGDVVGPVVRNPLKRKLGFTPLETTVIDYTLSRADIIGQNTDTKRSFIADATDVAYLDLDRDPSLFEGDAEEEYQYEIYRYMWGAVYHNDPMNQDEPTPSTSSSATTTTSSSSSKSSPQTPRRSPRKHNDNLINTAPSTPHRPPRAHPPHHQTIWSDYHPKTNLIWTHFILHTLLQNLQGNNEPATQTPESILRKIVDAGPEDGPRIHKKAVILHKILRKVNALLEPSALGVESKVKSVGDLVAWALRGEYLGVGDVVGGA
ncbi:hypothetical protein M011DRAFT_442451 [Sporormia fimetaria CBS 119925]|uniref:non-specific serine/threonine protein kinase n=1 Tax=Sporormia fimetaria CBS 119925 TaxID=1340428 RepID=A0A6A6VBV3_9PLEO|nr:hypothetical protein M011DRAFT_442451 [Sporormia fimetaria CBS 119925]